MKRVLLKAWTIEQGFSIAVHWQLATPRQYFKERYGTEAGIRRGEITVVVYQDFYQHATDPMSKYELQVVAKRHLDGNFAAYKIALG